jgi:type IV pilus assembly protein PilY1
MQKSICRFFSSGFRGALLALLLTLSGGVQAATTVLSNNPLYSASNVPANLMLALSIEFPTATVAAYKGTNDYSASTAYLGYFDNAKCYSYSTSGYFVPANTSGPVCSGTYWSGNMLNWATMAGLDEFRQALTGGNRTVDTTSSTILLRSNLTQQGTYSTNFPDKQIGSSVNVNPATVIGDSTIQTATFVYIRSGGMGTTFSVSNNASFASTGCLLGNLATCTKTYNAKVQVCVPGLLESNCNSAHASADYPNAGVYNKPDGLIQQNYTKIRVGASAYAFINGNSSPNGVVRALLRDNGPTVYNGNAARTTNANTEWDPVTGIFVVNPDSGDTTGTAPGGGNATKTGAINYLNQFGSNANYETYDTVGELYWATLAYYMQVPLDSRYTKALTTSNSLDVNFPVFGGIPPNDPISYSCQSNSIVTIGDDHTWSDTAVPSYGTLTSATGGALTPIPANGTVPLVDAYAYTTAVGNLPLIEGTNPVTPNYSKYYNSANPPSLGGVVWQNAGTYYLPGLAYFAHTNDIRNDVSTATAGKQTVTTYAVDVLEPGSFDGSASYPIYKPTSLSNSGPSIYWLAAKYGGFNDTAGTGKPASFLSWHTNSTTAAANTLRPDNYFFANQPDLLQSGLAQIFNKVSSTSAQNGAGPTVTATRVLNPVTANSAPYNSPVAGFPIYNPQYTPVSWDGDLSSFVATASVGSAVTAVSGTNTGDAQSQLETLTQTASGTSYGWDLGRRVITWNNVSASGVPFRLASLSTAEKTALNNDTTLLNFLRGDKTYEQTKFRGRNHILGDIVNSQAALVQGASSSSYTEKANPGYTNFTASVLNRQPVVYIGSNDGMLHAFAGDFSLPTSVNPVTGGGSELFAYVPSLLYNGPNGTPQVDGLSALANLSGSSSSTYNSTFVHHFYVDRTPQVADIDFNLTGLDPTASTASTANWHTILVGGLGKGGKGIYALDVTTVPTAIDTSSSNSTTTGEPALASKVLWEFTDADMGYSYGRPLIVKTRKYGWIVAITTGYDNNGSGQDGHGALYLLNAKTGALIQKIDTGAGSSTSPAGLAQATGYTQDISDGTIDQIYAGDLLGNVWRFDVSETAANSSGVATPPYPAPTLFATLTDPSGNAQPITTAPRIELTTDSSGLGTLRYVFVGTGQFLDTSDLSTTQQQTMYALRDGTGPTPATSGLPRSRTAVSPYNLVKNTLTTPLGLTDSSAGWYYDLTGSAGTSGGTERIVIDPDAEAGLNIVTWGTTTPSTNPCALGGAVYAADFTTGVSVLTDGSGNIIKSITTSSAPTSVQIVQLNGVYTVLYGQNGYGASTVNITQPTTNNSINQVNWREILD